MDTKEDKTKITQRIVIPNYLVSHLFKSDSKIRSIEQRWDCQIIASKADANNVNTSEGIPGRLVSLVGTPKSCSKAFYKICKEMIKLETMLNGTRKI